MALYGVVLGLGGFCEAMGFVLAIRQVYRAPKQGEAILLMVLAYLCVLAFGFFCLVTTAMPRLINSG